MSKKNLPVQIGQKYIIETIDISHQGEGIGKYNNFTIFVPSAVPGDQVEVKIISAKKSYARGLIEKILRPAPTRVEAACRYYDACGGCQLMHLQYNEQLKLKTNLVKEALTRIGGLAEIEVNPILGMTTPYNYRNKAQFPVRNVKGQLVIGGFKPRTHDIVELNFCHIQHPLINTALAKLKFILEQTGVIPYNELNHSGELRHLVIRVAPTTKQVMIVLVTRTERLTGKDQLIERIQQEIPAVVSIIQNINPQRTNVILGRKNKCLFGHDHIIDVLLNNQYIIDARSFYQVNSLQTAVLYQKAIDLAHLTGSETILDAYCGIGTIGLSMANKAKQVIGVEIVEPAVENARQNAQLNGIRQASFICGKAEQVIPKLLKQGVRPDILVVDPPRKGCDQALLQAIVKAQLQKIIYISCNPSTLARDLAYLTQQGYVVKEIQPVDMFPHTVHVETVVLMCASSKAGKC